MNNNHRIAVTDKLPPIEDVKKYIKAREEDPKLQAILKFTIAKDREEKYNRLT